MLLRSISGNLFPFSGHISYYPIHSVVAQYTKLYFLVHDRRMHGKAVQLSNCRCMTCQWVSRVYNGICREKGKASIINTPPSITPCQYNYCVETIMMLLPILSNVLSSLIRTDYSAILKWLIVLSFQCNRERELSITPYMQKRCTSEFTSREQIFAELAVSRLAWPLMHHPKAQHKLYANMRKINVFYIRVNHVSKCESAADHVVKRDINLDQVTAFKTWLTILVT